MLANSRDIISRLRQEGFEQVSVRGSHHKYVHPALRRMAVVPHPRKDIPQGTVRSIYKQAGCEKDWSMPHYIALIHKDRESGYGVSFPDLPGVVTVGDSIDDAMRKAAEVLAFASEDWSDHTGAAFPQPRTIDELRSDPVFQEDAADAVIAAVPFRAKVEAAE